MSNGNGKSPEFVVYTIIDHGKDRDDFWQRIGAAWSNKDGSLNVVLNALPVNGKMHIRAPKTDDKS